MECQVWLHVAVCRVGGSVLSKTFVLRRFKSMFLNPNSTSSIHLAVRPPDLPSSSLFAALSPSILITCPTVPGNVPLITVTKDIWRFKNV
jgi:hypothetical protein